MGLWADGRPEPNCWPSTWFDKAGGGDSFAYYSIGLLGGMILYYIQFLLTNDKEKAGELLTSQTEDVGGLPVNPGRVRDELRDIEDRT
jgi:hypothetical protein